jgi:uncharacterized protein GlcG (DUF336 family)
MQLGSRCAGKDGRDQEPGSGAGPVQCSGDPVGANCSNGEALTAAEVSQIVGQAVAEAQANGIPNATITVVDRVNNVLAVWQMQPAADPLKPEAENLAEITSSGGTDSGLEGILVPNTLAAISKAGTSSFFTSQANAFSTRTAGQVIQENFNPGVPFLAAGPLFGVQFSQLPCNPFSQRFDADASLGPKRLPLGFAADPGAVSLYKQGVPVGAVAVEYDGYYDVDQNVISGTDTDLEERVASAASFCFRAPTLRRANNITIGGNSLRFVEDTAIRTQPDCANPVGLPATGQLVPVTGFYGNFQTGTGDPKKDGLFPVCVGGTPPPDTPTRCTVNPNSCAGGGTCGVPALPLDGTPLIGPPLNASGFVETAINSPFHPDPTNCVVTGVDSGLPGVCAEILKGAGGVDRFFPPTPSTFPLPAAGGLSADEVQEIIYQVLRLAERTRSQVRLPIAQPARINVAVIDRAGEILGVARSRDALIFSLEVASQKAQTAVFFSDDPVPNLQTASQPLFNAPEGPLLGVQSFASYAAALQNFFSGATLPPDTAFSSTAVGGLGQPFYPSAQNGNSPGPLSRNFDSWSIFSTGFQTDSILAATAASLCRQVPGVRPVLAQALGIPLDDLDDPEECLPPETITSCTNPDLDAIDLGILLFPGGFPIYRGDQLIGGVGVSGDGVEQDDLIAFLGLHNAGVSAGTGFGNAPRNLRVDNLNAQGVRVRYARCALSPFLDVPSTQDACAGL